MSQKIRKAVIAAAGFGTRFLPQTKAMPKEMLPLIDKPIIQYIVEQLSEAGIEDIIIVTGYHKRSVEDHFDYINTDLLSNLKGAGKTELLKQTKHISDLANFIYVRQKGPHGNATPIMNVRHIVGDEPFIYTYADDLIMAKPNHYKQMIDTYVSHQASILPCLKIDEDEAYERYGIVDGEEIKDGLVEMTTIVEKPGIAKAPSNLASVGGYLLTPNIFDHLEELAKSHDSKKGEFQIQPAIRQMIDAGDSFLAMPIDGGEYYDMGNKLEYLKAVASFGLNDPKLGSAFEQFLRSRLS